MSDKLVSLAYTPAELKARRERDKACAPSDGEPKYPYGFVLRLDDALIKKLKFGISANKVEFRGVAEVTDRSERKTSQGLKRNIELQITSIAFEDARPQRRDVKPKTGAPNYPREAKSYVG